MQRLHRHNSYMLLSTLWRGTRTVEPAIVHVYEMPAVDLWPGDGLSHCGCEKCQAKSTPDLVWGFTERVGRELYQTHPDKLITSGAYTSYNDVSDKVGKFTPNVAIKISNSGRPKMNDPEHWADYTSRIERWKTKVAPGNLLRFERHPAYVEAVLGVWTEVRGESAETLVDGARAADLWALVDLAARAGENPVADRAEVLLRAVAAEGDLHAWPAQR